MQRIPHGGRGYSVKHEYIYAYALTIGAVDVLKAQTSGARVAQYGMTAYKALVRIGGLPEIRLPKLLCGNTVEAVVVIARHHEVDVVIPWNEALVPHGTKQSAALQPHAESMPAAYLQQFVGQL